MRKVLVVLLAALAVLSLFVGCKKEPEVRQYTFDEIKGAWLLKYTVAEGDFVAGDYINITITESDDNVKHFNLFYTKNKIAGNGFGTIESIDGDVLCLLRKGTSYKYKIDVKDDKLTLTPVDENYFNTVVMNKAITIPKYVEE